MATYKYAFENFDKETMAKASATNVAISLKKSVEAAKEIRGKRVSSVLNYLEKVANKEAVVPYRKFNAEMPHKRGKGIAAGGYPVTVAEEFSRLIKSAQKNASEQEISGELYLINASVRKGSNRYHFGRHQGRKMKSTNVEVIVGLKPKAASKKEVKKE